MEDGKSKMEDVKPRGLEKLPTPDLDINKLNEIRKVMENKKGVKEFIDVLDFVVSTGNTVKQITAADSPGGKDVVLTEYVKLVSPLTSLPSAITGITEVPAELTDTITEAEQKEIYDALNNADVDDVNKEEWLKDHLDAILKLKALIFKWYIKNNE